MKLVQKGKAISFNAGWHYKEYPGIVAISLADFHVSIAVSILLAKSNDKTEPITRFENM